MPEVNGLLERIHNHWISLRSHVDAVVNREMTVERINDHPACLIVCKNRLFQNLRELKALLFSIVDEKTEL